jgi:hypothetical protein
MSGRFAIGVFFLTMVACSPGGGEPPEDPPASTTTTLALTTEQAVGEFHSCLTDRGMVVTTLPIGDDGRPDLAGLADAVNPASAEWREALSACAAVIVESGALDLSGDPELAEAVRAQLKAFAVCMRSQGVEAFPDPPEDFDGTTPPFPVRALPAGDPDLGEAAQGCALTVGARSTG